jgi:hypothetical protein
MLTNEQRRLVSEHYNLALAYSRKSCRGFTEFGRVLDVAADGLVAAALKYNPSMVHVSFSNFLRTSIELRSHANLASHRRHSAIYKVDIDAVQISAEPLEPTLGARLQRAIELIQRSTRLKERRKMQYITFLTLRHSGLPLYKCAEHMRMHRNQATRIESAVLKFFRTELNHDD